MAAKVSKPVLYGGILVAVVAVIMLTSPSQPTGGKSSPKLSDLRKGKTTSKKSGVQVYPGDINAKFPRLGEEPRNSFMPLVVNMDAVSGGLAPNEFPASYAGGESGWFYTGTVIEDNVPSALVENTS